MSSRNSAVILLSRQHLRPSLANVWVQKLKRAVNYIQTENLILHSSVGTPNWEIITACAAIEKIPMRLFLSSDTGLSANEVTGEYGLDSSAVEFIKVKPITQKDKESCWKDRDRTIVDSSDILIPVSIRPGGYLEELILDAKRSGKVVVNDFRTEYEKCGESISYTVDKSRISDEIKSLAPDHIFHWTRSANGPWPDERKLDYYKDILSSEYYPRTAILTLRRIVETKTILASSRNMPKNIPTVSFSGLHPKNAGKLMKWRARYQQMSFEPYGIGVAKDFALSKGVAAVRYYQNKTEIEDSEIPVWLTQSRGKITDWSNEYEYRHQGDFSIGSIPEKNLILICRFRDEARSLENKFGIKTIAFCDQ